MGITVEDFVVFCERTIEGHMRAIDRLNDAQVNRAPDLPAANTPFQIVTHAFAACEWWCAHIVCGRPGERDRDQEFVATGTRSDLRVAAAVLRDLLADLRPGLEAATTLAHEAVTREDPLDGEWTPGAAMIHAYEELAQHLGHLEVTVDIVLAG